MTETAYAGHLDVNGLASDSTSAQFMARQMIARGAYVRVVKVIAVRPGAVGATGNVDVQPMVGQIDGEANLQPHGNISALPYFRLQGGANAVVMDPAVGDIGIAVFEDRDTSRVKATRASGAPGSRRKHSFSDGFYIGGFLNGTPTQYVQFGALGIKLVSPVAVTISAPNATLDSSGNLTVTGNITDLGNAHGTMQSFRVAYDGHTHSDPQGGSVGTPSNTI